MSTQAVSGLSIQQELQTLRQNRLSDAQPHNNHEQASPAIIVSLSGTQNPSGTSAVSQPNPEPVTLDYKQFRAERSADMKQLGQALASGDLTAAKAAYDKLVQLGKFGPLENGQTFKRSDRAQDFQAIGQALQSGDLAGAEQAFTALKSSFNHVAHGGPEPPLVNPNSTVVINVTYQTSGSNATPPSEPPVFHGGPKPPVYGGGTTTPPVGTLPPSEPPVSGGGTVTAPPIGTLPPSEPPVSGGGTVAAPPIGTLPPSEPPVSGGGTTASNVSEIVINIGGSGTSQQQSANGELVVNLAAPSAGSPEELKLNFAGSNGSSNQLTIDVAQTQGQNGSTGEQISIDLSKLTSNENVVLNLYGNSSSTQTPTQTQSSSLNVNA